ncbi:UNVERIFIED_CONTAM: hypothetical protein K2H54_026419 [Gekko kuhli]
MGPANACLWGETHPPWRTRADCPAEQLQIHGDAYLSDNAHDGLVGNPKMVAHLSEAVRACEPPRGYGHPFLWGGGLSHGRVRMRDVVLYMVNQPVEGGPCDPEVLQPLLILPGYTDEGVPPLGGAGIHPPASWCTLLTQSRCLGLGGCLQLRLQLLHVACALCTHALKRSCTQAIGHPCD